MGKNKRYGHTAVNMVMGDEDVERLDRLCEKFDTCRSDMVAMALEVYENLLKTNTFNIQKE